MAMFENFPYTDMHNLNLDWIIKIAKDFLDQYTHIQELIEQGITDIGAKTDEGIENITELTETSLSDLQAKYENLENLLQAWYNTHSNDIANQLTQALSDVATATATALNNINTTKNTALSDIADYVNDVIASIPADYSALSAMVQELNNKTVLSDYTIIDNQYVNYTNGNFSVLNGTTRTNKISLKGYSGITVVINGWGDNRGLAFYDASGAFIANSGVQYASGLQTLNIPIPANAEFVAFSLPVTSIVFTNNLSNLNYYETEIMKDSNFKQLNNNFVTGNYINSENGNFSILGGAKRTDLIPTDFYDKLYLLVCGFNDIRGCAFYDENRDFIRGVAYSVQGMGFYSIDIPFNAKYFAYTFSNDIDGERAYLSKTFNALRKADTAYDLTIIKPELHFTENNYINCTNGNRSVLSGCYASFFIDCKDIKQIILSDIGYNDNRGLAWYDKNGNFIEGVSYSAGYNSYILAPTGNRRYLAVTKASAAFEIYMIPESIKPDTVENSISMFKSIAGCGDSYTSCVLYTINGVSRGENEYASWISNIGRTQGINSFIYAHGGATTETYLSLEDCLPKLLNEPARDLYILNLGINDAGYGVNLGTIADIHADYTENPNTFYGNYGRIIDQIIQHAPNAKLIISKILYATSAQQEVTNAYRYSSAAIEAIANHYNIPFIETLDSKYISGYEFSTQKYSGHPTAVQQAKVAEAMTELINKCISDNYSYFADY